MIHHHGSRRRRIHKDNNDVCYRHLVPAMSCSFFQKSCIIFFLLFIDRSVALVQSSRSIPDIHRRWIGTCNRQNVFLCFSLADNREDDQDFVPKDTNNREKDDYVLDEEADDYISKFISDTLETTNNADDISSKDEVSAIIETKRMIQQQQQQIDLLMNLVKQQNQQQSPQQEASYDDILKKEESPDKKSQIQQNVAPLKANLFVDGTWLYYSLNTRNPDRCPIIKKFGRGWQNNYKVDW